jgi:hypothetical protein
VLGICLDVFINSISRCYKQVYQSPGYFLVTIFNESTHAHLHACHSLEPKVLRSFLNMSLIGSKSPATISEVFYFDKADAYKMVICGPDVDMATSISQMQIVSLLHMEAHLQLELYDQLKCHFVRGAFTTEIHACTNVRNNKTKAPTRLMTSHGLEQNLDQPSARHRFQEDF